MDYRLPLMVGIDIPIPELQLTLHIPTLKDIAFMGEQNFFTAIQYLCLEKESLIEDETILSSFSNFQVLMKVLQQTKDSDKKNAVITLLKLLFPNYSPSITPNSIILIMVDNPTIMIDNNNFDTLQSVLRSVLCVNSLFQGNNIIYNPVNDMAKKIADKLMRGRKKVAELNKGNSDSSILTRYISILSMAQGIPVSCFENYNLFQLFDAMDRYTKKTEWDTDMKVRLAGGKPDKQVESWMIDLHPN